METQSNCCVKCVPSLGTLGIGAAATISLFTGVIIGYQLRHWEPQAVRKILLRTAGVAVVYPNNLKNWDLDRVKAPGFDDLNPPNITNIEQVEIAEPRGLSRRSKTNSSGYLGIAGILGAYANFLLIVVGGQAILDRQRQRERENN